jgi:hypothetical protein
MSAFSALSIISNDWLIVTQERGPSTFRLSFNLPYYALRHGSEPKIDQRFLNKTPLRTAMRVSSLCLGETSDTGFLYKAHKSFMIAGIDQWRWTAYLFADSYFDGDSGETMLEHQAQWDCGSQAPILDPLARGEIGVSDLLSRDPRQYFTTAFRAQLTQIEHEWRFVIENMEEHLDNLVRVSTNPIKCIGMSHSTAPLTVSCNLPWSG